MFFTKLRIVSIAIILFLVLQREIIQAETFTTKNCALDTSQPSRNILEITGDYSTTFFNVDLSSTNCHIYIHDIVFGGITFSSSITTNSNITIQNATSTNKVRPTFINFGGVISDFGFININNINHSSLEITPTASTDWISGVKFGSSITGKTDLTSWMNISNVVMNEIMCDSSSQRCQTAMAKFASPISSLASLNLENFTATNISMKSSSGSAVFCCQYFLGALQSVQQISLFRIAVSNVRVENAGTGNAETKLSFFAQSVTASSPSPVITRFVVQEYQMNNISVAANVGASSCQDVRLFGSIINFTILSFTNMTISDVNSTSSNSSSSVCLFCSGALNASYSASIAVNNIRVERVNSTGLGYSNVYLLNVVQSITNYTTLSFSNMTISDVNSTSSSIFSFVYLFRTAGSLISSSSSSSIAKNLVIERVNSRGNTGSEIMLFYVVQSITNYSTLSFTNMSISDVNSTSSTLYSYVFLIITSSMVSSSSSSIHGNNLRIETVKSIGSTTSVIYLFVVDQSITNFANLSFTNMTISDVNSSSSIFYSLVYLFYSGGSVVSSSSPSSSITTNNLQMERVKSIGSGNSNIYLFYVGQSITNYSTLSFSNMIISDVNSTSTSYSIVYLFRSSGSIVSSSSSSSITANNLRVEKVNSRGQTSSEILLFWVGQLITNYSSLSFTNISLLDVNSTSSSSFSIVHLFKSVGSVISSSSSSSVSGSDLRMERVNSRGYTVSEILLFLVGQSITNYTTLSFANMTISNVNSTSSTSYSIVYLFVSGGSVVSSSSPSSSITTNNLQMERVKSIGSGNSNIYLFYVGQSITNYSTLSFSNMIISDVNSTSTSYSIVYLFRSAISIFSSPSSSSITGNNLRIEKVNSRGYTSSTMMLFWIAQSITNYSTLSFSNMTMSEVNSTSTNSYSQIYLVSTGSIVAPATSTIAKLTFNNLELRNIAAIAATEVRVSLFNMIIPSSIQGFSSVTFSDSILENVMTQSTNDSFVILLRPTGFLDCNSIRITNNQLTNVVANSSTGKAIASLVNVQSSTTNVRFVEVNNNLISNISVVAPTQNGELSLTNSSFDQVEMISLRNNKITLDSLPSTTSSSSNISVSMVPLSISSGSFNLDISNCTLEIQNEYWHQLCSTTNCSLVRVNDVQNNNNKNNISISESSITSPSSSFISFANFGNGLSNRNEVALNFVLEKNYLLNFTSPSSSVSIFGFDNSSRLPPFVFVDVKCNHWPRLTDRALSQQLIDASSAQQVDEFIAWTCHTHSASKTVSPSVSSASSITASFTRSRSESSSNTITHPVQPATTTTTTSTTNKSTTPPNTSSTPSTTTTTQTSLAPVTQVVYAPLPSTLNDTVIQVNTSNVQPDSPLVNVSTADNLNNISQILQALQTQQMQATNDQGVTLLSAAIPSTKLFVPYQGLGEFIIRPTAECKFNSKLDFRVDSVGTSVQILATSSGSTADVEYAVKNCVAFNPSQATIDRNISAQKFLGVQIQSGSAQATTALALDTLVFNHGPISSVLTHNCSTNVPRGSRFTANLGFVFTHALGLPMTITATGADLFPLPTTVKSVQNSSGFVTVRGTISDTEPLAILFIATDSLTPAVQAICTITPVFINLRLKNPMVVPYEIHAGIDFNFYIPSDMFESSSPFWIDYVTQKNGLPLPNGVSFQKPWSIAGRMPAVGLFNWTAFAADDFNEARGYILINSTNSAPRIAVSEPHNLGLAFAARDMSLEIDLSALFVDSDNDALKYYMNTTELAQIPWLRANVAPGGFTKTPQKLTLTGSVPRTARGTNFTLQLFCSDGYNETVLVTVLRIAQGAAPIQIKALPSYTIAPEEVLSEQLAMSDFFVSPDGDQMIVTYTLRPVVTWVTITNNPGAGGAPPTLAVTASVTQIEDTEDFIIITVSNALGDSVNATASIYVRQTDWQKLQAMVFALSAVIGILTTVLGTFVYWPHIVNAFHGSKLVKKCPLEHTTPRFEFPEGTVKFECTMTGSLKLCGVDLYKGFDHISHYLFNHLSQKPTPNSGPPVWLKVLDRHIVLELPPPPKDDIGVKIVLCRFWNKRGVLIEEFEVNYDECYEGYVYDEKQIAMNDLLIGEKARGGAVALNVRNLTQEAESTSTMLSQHADNVSVSIPPDETAVSKSKFDALELELVESRALQTVVNERMRLDLSKRDQDMIKRDAEMARQRLELTKQRTEVERRDQETKRQREAMRLEIERRDQEMAEMRNTIKEILGRDGEVRPQNPLYNRNTNMFSPSANDANFDASEFVYDL